MKRRRKYLPYIRRANGSEMATSYSMAILLAEYVIYQRNTGRGFYVMVQHGFPATVMNVGASKRELKESIVPVLQGKRTYRGWCKHIQKYARGY